MIFILMERIHSHENSEDEGFEIIIAWIKAEYYAIFMGTHTTLHAGILEGMIL